ncbi:MAG: lamin tail domain-containing protein [Anaerolineae bacterium]|nr:lamin tail domain-containing protein [Anaerolineae bacterium]
MKWLLAFLLGLVLLPGGQTGDGRLLLTEIYYATPGEDTQQEWVEIDNVGTAVFPLANVTLTDEEQAGGPEGAVQFPSHAVIAPGEVVIVAQTAVGFRALFGFDPGYEMVDSDTAVPDMLPHPARATGPLVLNNDGDELILLAADGQLLDAVSYGDSTALLNPPIPGVFPGQSIARIPARCDTNTAADWQPQTIPTPGQIHTDGVCAEAIPSPTQAADTLPPIGAIQGSGSVSPRFNEVVTLRGVLTGIYEDRNTAGVTYYTLFVQDVPGQEDGDPATSDGIAVFLGQERPSAQIGDQVRISGRVMEFFGLTEIDDDGLRITVEASGLPLPEPVVMAPPADNGAQAAYFEPLEGMRGAFAGEARVVGATFSGCSFAAVDSTVIDRPVVRQQFTDPIGQIVPILHTSDVDCGHFPHVKSGDQVAGLAGPLIYHFDQFKLVQQETGSLVVTAVTYPPLPSPPSLAENQISIALYNMENHFDAHDDTGSAEEPKPTPAEIARKEAKIAGQISQFLACPTLVGVQEVENEALLLSLAQALAAPCGFVYDVTHRESADIRGIDVALLSDPRQVTVQNATLRQTCTPLDTGIVDKTTACPAGQQPLFSRPPLAVEIMVGGRPFTIFINHFKSKRGGEVETAPQRLAQAHFLNEQVTALLAADTQARVVVMGDFNDYELSPALLAMTGDGRLTNALSTIPLPERYSFVFSGAAQLIDGILLSPALAANLTHATIQHLNADYPDVLAADTAVPYQATDHDLPLIILNLEEGVSMPTPLADDSTTVSALEAPGNSWSWVIGVVLAVAAGGTAVWFIRRRA